MEPEKRMILAAAFLAVAQQDMTNVKWLGVRPSKVQVLSTIISAEARRFVQSPDFEEMCEVVDLDAETLRDMSPEMALKAYQKITSDDWSKN
jgi:hypothetical protein